MQWQLQLVAGTCALLVIAARFWRRRTRRSVEARPREPKIEARPRARETSIEHGARLPDAASASTLLDQRFLLEEHAGSGGMGQVFRALDQKEHTRVAVKVMRVTSDANARRFEREISVLASLRHPGIVRYVAHGVSETGRNYLAMEWLEGEDLARRLRRGPLSVRATLAIGRQVADALDSAHARDVVHRDLKPSNLWLVGADSPTVKLLDFGIAQLADAPTTANTGAVLGTPGYMAPEQASGAQTIDARTDVFALGCVLFECLTGAPPFRGENMMAVLAKLLFQDAPRLIEERPDAPPALDALLARMLARSQEERPRDGAALRAALVGLESELACAQGTELPLRGLRQARSLTSQERRMLSVILIAARARDNLSAAERDELAHVAQARGGAVEWLADGTAVVTFATGVASDQAVQAARVALGVRTLALGVALAVATGRTELSGELPIGDAIDRAARMLRARLASDQIAIDDVTAGLLDARFVLDPSEHGLLLVEERELTEGTPSP